EFSTRKPHAPLPARAGRLSDRHAGKGFIVTGAAGGVGRAAAELLLAEGGHVVLADVKRDRLDEAVAAIGNPRATAVTLDATAPASIAALISEAEARLGQIDGLVNCAAIVVHVDPLETPWRDWGKTFAVNVFGAYEAARLAAKAMIKKGVRG